MNSDSLKPWLVCAVIAFAVTLPYLRFLGAKWRELQERLEPEEY